mmetsp:Transcript_46649/g.116196  ORF Transcript_46649/g.116196 Transcript_46649/m.116196 type:complete len:368 (-) Transcript_46649:160-1263(-)
MGVEAERLAQVRGLPLGECLVGLEVEELLGERVDELLVLLPLLKLGLEPIHGELRVLEHHAIHTLPDELERFGVFEEARRLNQRLQVLELLFIVAVEEQGSAFSAVVRPVFGPDLHAAEGLLPHQLAILVNVRYGVGEDGGSLLVLEESVLCSRQSVHLWACFSFLFKRLAVHPQLTPLDHPIPVCHADGPLFLLATVLTLTLTTNLILLARRQVHGPEPHLHVVGQITIAHILVLLLAHVACVFVFAVFGAQPQRRHYEALQQRRRVRLHSRTALGHLLRQLLEPVLLHHDGLLIRRSPKLLFVAGVSVRQRVADAFTRQGYLRAVVARRPAVTSRHRKSQSAKKAVSRWYDVEWSAEAPPRPSGN